MDQRISIVTLGVADLAGARTFYERLGWCADPASTGTIVFFDLGGMALALYGRAALAEDAGFADTGPGFAGVTLAHNVGSPAAVEAVLDQAVAAGGRLIKPAAEAFWGGYSGYFADPDGHLWEVAYNPFFPLDDKGRVHLAPPDQGPD
ncbi:MAG: VOC family protein [Alphaproteobacteria bacterium]|nr:VOC family protein [Alphaproteobacteria bacterium]